MRHCLTQKKWHALLSTFTKLWKATISFVISVHLSTRLSSCKNPVSTARIFMKFFWKSIEKIQVLLKSEKNKGSFTQKPKYICGSLSLNCSQNEKYFKQNQSTYFMFKIFFFFEKYTVYEIIRNNMADCVWNMMAHAQKPEFFFRRNGRVHLNRRRASVQSTAGSQGVRMSISNAGYTIFRGSVKSTGYPLHSPVSPSLPLPCVTVCHHVSHALYYQTDQGLQYNTERVYCNWINMGIDTHSE